MKESTFPIMRVGIGQKSHRFLPAGSSKPCMISGVIFNDTPGLSSDSDGDVVFQAICNAISSLTGVPILEGIAKDLCAKDGITDSQVYLKKALEILGRQIISHVALSIEGKRPLMQAHIIDMRMKVAQALRLDINQVGLTVISGDGLTDCGCGDGVHCFCVLTTQEL